MTTGIYHWKLGDIALARVCKKVYANVQVVKDEKGLFYDDKVLGISGNLDGSITVTKELCYYVQTCNTKNRFWLPYTSMHLAERSRPFYGPAHKAPKVSPPTKTPSVPRKRKIKEDLTVPFNVKLSKLKEPDLNATYDIRHTPLKQGRYENAFKEFIRRGKEMLFDQYYAYLQTDVLTHRDALDYVMNVDASTEDKFEMVIKTIVSEKEIENYLHQCWRYNFLRKHTSMGYNYNNDSKDGSDSSICHEHAQDVHHFGSKWNQFERDGRYNCHNSCSPVKAMVTIHAPWCLVCGKGDRLRECPNCPSSFHLACRREWLVSILHRKNPPQKPSKPVTLVEKILSSTRTICTVRKEKENTELCPSCMWGPKVGYDDVVWHKLGQCPWWPARVLTPGAVPSCLLARTHSPHHWPLRYYGTLNHSWGEASRMCLFLPSHANNLPKDESVAQAVLDACDDYISVYLT